jgi:hypothetical protein
MELLSRLCDYFDVAAQQVGSWRANDPGGRRGPPFSANYVPLSHPDRQFGLIRRVQPESETTRSKVEAGEEYLATCSMFVCVNQSDKGRKNEN